jgi:DNA polymerase
MRQPNLSRAIGDCTKCGLYKTRRSIVVGKGSIPAAVLFVGEAPGLSEDAVGIPFFGPSGKLLDCLLESAGFNVPYYITNTILCHPCDKIGGANREPNEQEVFACRDNILSVYDSVGPELTIFVGKVAESWYKKIFKPNVTILHPSFLLRTGGRASPHYQLTLNKLLEVVCRMN